MFIYNMLISLRSFWHFYITSLLLVINWKFADKLPDLDMLFQQCSFFFSMKILEMTWTGFCTTQRMHPIQKHFVSDEVPPFRWCRNMNITSWDTGIWWTLFGLQTVVAFYKMNFPVPSLTIPKVKTGVANWFPTILISHMGNGKKDQL